MTIQLLTLREKFTASLLARGYAMSETARHHVFTRDGDPELIYVSPAGLIRRGPSERRAARVSTEEREALLIVPKKKEGGVDDTEQGSN